MARINELIQEAKLNNSKILNLVSVDERLTVFPDEILELTKLEELSFGSTLINSIPDKIVNLQNLTKLHISGTFTDFPLKLREIKALTEIQFQTDYLEALPSELDKWDQLDYLNLGRCKSLRKISGLPSNLEYIHIGQTALTQIPETIFGLNNLKKIVAVKLGLKSLPNELFTMKNMSSIYVGHNSIQKFPDTILKLENLLELWIDSNGIQSLPTVITRLVNLRNLNLRDNLLNDLPKDFKNLKHLEYLDIGNNSFTKIPSAVFHLKKLKDFKISNFEALGDVKSGSFNKITEIPNDILSLQDLVDLDVFKNPIANIPSEILTRNFAGIRNYLVSRIEADTEEYLYEAKMVIVGRGNVGKTVLRRKLTEPNYTLTESKTTLGIDVIKESFNLKMKGLVNTDTFKFNIWDFGGQEKYDATHQLFITDRSVYLFLTEAREESNYLDFYHWLNTISVFASNAPIIVVLSKFDERKKHLPSSIYREKFENIIDFVEISCADGYESTIERLKTIITEAITKLPQTTQKLSNKWIDVRNELERLMQNRDYISYERYLEVCKSHHLDQSRADFLSLYLNDLGVIIHHQNDLLLKKTVFLSTDWCVDGMYKVLDNESIIRNNGLFTISELNQIWTEQRFSNKQEELLKLMREYQLCFQLKDGSGFIAPELLPHDKPKYFDWNNAGNLQFEVRYDFMPAGILSRFIVKSHSFIKEKTYWKYGVVLEYDETLGLVEEDYINSKIKIRLIGENKKGLLSAIRMIIEEVHRDFDRNNKLIKSEMVPCNCLECQTNDIPHFYKYSVLRKFEQKAKETIPCERSGDDVLIKSLISDVQVPDQSIHIVTDLDLKNYVYSLMITILEHEISFKGGYINFWRNQSCTEPKNEIEFQSYICNVLDNYCKVIGIQLSREVKEANGGVDILFTYNNKFNDILRVCVEIKKAHHADVITSIYSQLPLYMKSVGTKQGIYLVVWFKNKTFIQPKQFESSSDLLNQIKLNSPKGLNIAPLIIDCTKKNSPSKIRS